MYPNPQAALPLPPRPSLEQYKKQAKDLVRACTSGDPEAIGDWAQKWIEALARRHGSTHVSQIANQLEEFAGRKLSARCLLTDAQFVIARAHGFVSWPKFAKHIEGVHRASSAVSKFELAADAIVAGDARTLERLLSEHPELIRARSTREHRATLLHYVSANGVEGYRQRTPKNIVTIAAMLLRASADVDAEADVYGGRATTLLLAATSFHPERAGVQIPLLELLLEHGAEIREGAVRSCLANGRIEAAEFLAGRGARLDLESAAGVGRLDLVKRLSANATEAQTTAAFLWACQCGRNNVIEFLLDKGADIAARDEHGQSGLHRAVLGAQLQTIKLLLARHAPLEVRNVYGGTVLGQTLWSAAHGGEPEVYIPIIETLIAAGAKLRDRHPPVNPRVDELLRSYDSRTDSSLAWFGERPISGRGQRRAGHAKS